MSGRRVWWALLGLAVLASQAGHLLAYQLRFGAAAQHLQGSGAHAYFPTLAKTGLGMLAALTIGGLFMVGFARIAGGRALSRESTAPSYLRLVAAMYTIQLGIFVVQELSESAAAGTPAPSLTLLLLWGTLGQLPVAALAATGLRWLLVRFRAAAYELGAAVAPLRFETAFSPLVQLIATVPHAALLQSRAQRASLAERGPPSPLRFSSN
ncbi:MAG TPA: hypothetical protein VND96_10305 [Candidatus Micrarchaeaceae archaeon]|nr:hypothetical protein [Candidatus Micrarchaeaceae archaeon]